MVTKEEGIRRMIRFAFSDDDGDPDLSALPEFKAALEKAEQRGREAERAAVVKYLRHGFGPEQAKLIESGKHIDPSKQGAADEHQESGSAERAGAADG